MPIDHLTIIQDSREQLPFEFSPAHKVIVQALPVGDYSLEHMTEQIIIERKTLSDLVSSVTAGRERFVRELRQLRAFKYAGLVIESSWSDVLEHKYTSAMTVNSLVGSLMSFSVKYGVQVLLAGDHRSASILTERILLNYARSVEREYKMLCAAS